LHVESVAWVAERKDVLSGVFWMACLCAYSLYVEKPGFKRYTLVFLFFALGLMSKPSAVAIPCTLLLIDYWPLGRLEESVNFNSKFWSRALCLIVEKVPLLIVAAVGSVAAFKAQQELGAMASLDTYSLSDRIDNAIVSYVLYVARTFWPRDLAVIYVHVGHWPFASVLAGGAFLGVVSYLIWSHRSSFPYLLMGWLWFLGTLVPMIGLVQVGAQSMADRYTYISLIGLFIMLVWGVAELATWCRIPLQVSVLSAMTIILLLVGLAQHQLLFWQDGTSLFAHATRATDNNWLAHHNYGLCLANLKRYREADAQFLQALQIAPHSPVVNRSRGFLYLEREDRWRASELLTESLQIDPKNVDANRDLALIYATAPEAELRNGQLALSYAFTAYSLAQEPGAPEFETLAMAFAENGYFEAAIEAEEYACLLVGASGQNENEFVRRLELYRSGRPLRLQETGPFRHTGEEAHSGRSHG
jgi:protein O-mannosyl-transferase